MSLTQEETYNKVLTLLSAAITANNNWTSIKPTKGTFYPNKYVTIALGDWLSYAYDNGYTETDFIKKDVEVESSTKYLHCCDEVCRILNNIKSILDKNAISGCIIKVSHSD